MSSLLGWSARLSLIALLLLLGVNGAVRYFGGNPHLLSPLHMKGKLAALGSLALHLALHPLRDCSAGEPNVGAAARRHRVPRELVAAVARAESAMQRHRISRAGAMGLMQLMPLTAAELGVEDPYDPRQSIDGGARYLGWLYRRYRGDQRRVVAAYNLGPGRVPRRGALRLPGETRHYLRRVLSR